MNNAPNYRRSITTGFSFGLTSGIITTLGLMVGLNSSTHSMLAVVGGVLTIAIADAFSDAFAMHITEEVRNAKATQEIWTATFSTLMFKFITAITFLIPLLLVSPGSLTLDAAIIASIAWGLLLITIFNYFLARKEKAPAWKIIGEHLIIAIIVVVLANLAGSWINAAFG